MTRTSSAIDRTAGPGTPVVIEPGKRPTITVTITPTGGQGHEGVSGVLNLVTPPQGVQGQFNTTGDVLAALPYSYTVK